MTSSAVLVTGCSSGIGRATALAFAAAGRPTWGTVRAACDAEAELERAGCRVLRLDVTDDDACVRAVRAVEAEHGAVGALVNNAGFTLVGPLEETPVAELRRIFETNTFAVARLCQLVLPKMREHGGGTIVNLGSVAGLLTPPGGGAYSMTKYALEAFSDALRLEVRPFGVRVVLLEPAGARTRLMTTGMPSMPAQDGPYRLFKQSFEVMVAHAHREGAPEILVPEDVARVAVRAVNARRPKARYRIGVAAHVAPLVRRLAGDRLWDALMDRQTPAG